MFLSFVLPGNFCHQQSNGRYANPDDCTKFITCYGGTVYIQNCPATLYFNPHTANCDYLSGLSAARQRQCLEPDNRSVDHESLVVQTSHPFKPGYRCHAYCKDRLSRLVKNASISALCVRGLARSNLIYLTGDEANHTTELVEWIESTKWRTTRPRVGQILDHSQSDLDSWYYSVVGFIVVTEYSYMTHSQTIQLYVKRDLN